MDDEKISIRCYISGGCGEARLSRWWIPCALCCWHMHLHLLNSYIRCRILYVSLMEYRSNQLINDKVNLFWHNIRYQNSTKIHRWRKCITGARITTSHDEVIKWKHFSRCWPFVRGIHRSPVNSPHKASDAGLWCFLWSAPEPTVEVTVEMPVIWDAIALIVM